ncbi:MAG: hypothetical protein NVSMB2_12190 [Chloroflexota bacterium]
MAWFSVQPSVLRPGLHRQLLAWTLATSLVPLVLLALVCAQVTEQMLMERFEADAVGRAQAVTMRLRDRVSATTQAARMVAEIQPTRDVLSETPQTAARLLLPLKTRLGLDVLNLANKDGQIVGAAQDNARETVPGELLGPFLLKAEQSWYIDSEARSGGLLLHTAAPIRQDGALVGVVEAGTRLDRDLLLPLVERATDHAATAPPLIGLFWNDQPQTGTDDLIRQLAPPSVDDLRQAPSSHISTHVTLNGTPYFGVFSTVDSHQSTPIVIAVLVSLASVETVRTVGGSLVALMVLALAAGVTWTSYKYSGSFVRPLVDLAAAARRLQAGNLDTIVDQRSPYQLGELETAFATMARALKTRECALAELVAQLETRASTDELTGLPNRTALHQRLQQLVGPKGHVVQRQAASLLLIDLDRFKDVNDTLGHQAGDVVLQQVARRFRDIVHTSDAVARLGGDEFAVLLSGSGIAGAVRVAQKLIHSLDAPLMFGGTPLDIGASIGITVLSGDGDTPATLLRQADVAMYESKRKRSGYECYTPELDGNTSERVSLLGELRPAIADGQLVLHFQPKIGMQERRIVHAEALVRWQHPVRGLVPPDIFIPLAEQSGLVHPLTEWVLDAALAQYRVWRNGGRIIPLAVNVSAQNLHEPTFEESITTLLRKHDIPAGDLTLEITETSVLQDPEHATQVLGRLQTLGIRIAIDDFGAGHSALAYLKQLPVDELKIDRSFVRDLAHSPRDGAIVGAAIELGHRLGFSVVAEGVEDKATWDQLRLLGCDIAQGYYMARPLAPHALEAWIDQWDWSEPPEQADRAA